MNNSNTLPSFIYQGAALRAKELRYNPCDDVIFPSILDVEGKFPLSPGRYLMYYAPHDAPGGICLAYSNSLDGPWREWEENPIIGRKWSPHYDVSHVSSPHAIWVPEEKKVFLYFHGENDTTRLASSANGIHFEYEGVVVTTAMYDNISESSYARVFPAESPIFGKGYIMLFMGNNQRTRRIYSAWSKDGRTFQAEKKPLVNPPEGTGVTQVGGPWLLRWRERNLVFFHGDVTPPNLLNLTSNIYAADVGNDFQEENHLGVVFRREMVSGDNARVCDPCFVEDERGGLRLFFAMGGRLKQDIGVARVS